MLGQLQLSAVSGVVKLGISDNHTRPSSEQLAM